MSPYICLMHYFEGHSLETFPKEMVAVRDAGHEMFVITRTTACFIDNPCTVDFMDIPMRYAQYVTNLLDLIVETTESDKDVA